MPKDQISMRQLLVLLFTALLSPAIQTLPGWSAALAGRAGWLSPLVALPAVLGLCGILFALLRAAPAGEGLAAAFEVVLGRAGGKLLTAVYLLWGELLLCTGARRSALRLLSASYRNVTLPLLLLTLLAAALWMGRGRLSRFARGGEIFYLALSATLGILVLLALLRLEARNVLPIWAEEVPGLLAAALPTLSAAGCAVFAAFLAGSVVPRPENKRRSMRWAVALCLSLTAVQLACLGAFGPTLVRRMNAPFFIMVKELGVTGAFERVESVVVALWILADVTLLGLLVFACRAMTKRLFRLTRDGRAAYYIVGLALLGAVLLFRNSFTRTVFAEIALAAGNLLLGFLVPLLVLLLGKLRGKV